MSNGFALPENTAPRRTAPAAALVAAAALLLAGCASTPAPADTTAALRARLPKAILSSGVLRIGSDLNYTPVDFRGQDGSPTGLDIDLGNALAAQLGLRAEFVDQQFATLIPAVQHHQLDLAMSAVIDTQQRETGVDANGTQVDPGADFVDYFLTGTAILVRAGNPLSVVTLDDLCGHTVALQRGTVQADIAAGQVNVCRQAGKTLTVDLFDTDDQALAEVASGKAAADLNDYPVAAWNTRPDNSAGRFQVTGALLQTSLYGITVNKADTGLRDALSKALDHLIIGGQYDTIIDKWGAQGGRLAASEVDGSF
ncbi:ABC transporter substrate-binding protein [Kitasatospora viridis]|uniref:Amino acid ABC transporter substrate-binding protein (PAAT family) n=1 Tax=Kitasatospora viridis TaxID=281105 RepID=A0A561UF11_9ACTN|nr:ABC transporter substrate-binding protein [Kitasatospora viridis]TWF97952.1 amino acid ABC transporter substrate-binding protein (PAAT family) [Kitasatospora viridis]